MLSPQSPDSEEYQRKRNRKHRHKSKEEHSRKHGRVKSAYVKQRIPLHIVPTMKDNRMLLHAYPMHNFSQPPGYSTIEKDRVNIKFNPKFVKKLEYSSDKFQNSGSKHKRSGRKNRERNPKVEKRLRNTLSGEKRSSQSDSNNSLNKRRSISEDSEILLGKNTKQLNRTSTMLKITRHCDGYLQAFASAGSGDSSGDSKNKKRLSAEKMNPESSFEGPSHNGTHLRFKSLADSNYQKFKIQNKLISNNRKSSNNHYRKFGNVLEKIDMNVDNVIAPFYNPEGINYSYENIQGTQGLENKENFNFLESQNTIEDKMEPLPPIPNIMAEHINIFGVDKPKDLNETSNDKSRCNWKKSRCLKLYCEWFSSGLGCNKDWNWVDCINIPGNILREEAMRVTKERNPSAFKPKILFQGDRFSEIKSELPGGRHTKGWNCKKSYCLKKYWEWFQSGVQWTSICKCEGCKNWKDSRKLEPENGLKEIKVNEIKRDQEMSPEDVKPIPEESMTDAKMEEIDIK